VNTTDLQDVLKHSVHAVTLANLIETFRYFVQVLKYPRYARKRVKKEGVLETCYILQRRLCHWICKEFSNPILPHQTSGLDQYLLYKIAAASETAVAHLSRACTSTTTNQYHSCYQRQWKENYNECLSANGHLQPITSRGLETHCHVHLMSQDHNSTYVCKRNFIKCRRGESGNFSGAASLTLSHNTLAALRYPRVRYLHAKIQL
jgi:hypothetical protein